MNGHHILIISADLNLSAQTALLLQQNGFTTAQSQNTKQGLSMALEHSVELILLDTSLPDIDGFLLLRQLRKEKQTPVMMITAKATDLDRLHAYSSGADDCLAKPVNLDELLLRIQVLLRRCVDYDKPVMPGISLTVDQLTLNRCSQYAEFAGTALSFTPVQFKLLWLLLEHKHQVLSKPLLYKTVLGRPFCRCDRSLDMHLSRVRKKLVAAGMPPDRLVTVHGQGYCFT